MLPLRTAREQQDRYIRTADQEQRSHCPEQQIQRGPEWFRVQFGDAAQGHAKTVRISVGLLPRVPLENRLQFGVRLRHRDSRSNLERHSVADLRIHRDLEWNVDIRLAPSKTRRHHSENSIVLAHEL